MDLPYRSWSGTPGQPPRTHLNEALTELLGPSAAQPGILCRYPAQSGQDGFSSCLFVDCSQMVSSLLARRPGELSLAEQEMAARFYAHAVIGLAMGLDSRQTSRQNLKRLSPCCRSCQSPLSGKNSRLDHRREFFRS